LSKIEMYFNFLLPLKFVTKWPDLFEFEFLTSCSRVKFLLF